MKRTKSTLSVARWLLVSTLICGSAVVFTSCGNMDNALEEIINGNPTAKGISFAQSKVAVHFGDDTFTNALTNKGDGTVTYTSSNTAVATVNPTTGEVTPVDLGTTTITATVTESGDYTYETKTASYELSVGVSILKWDETLKEMKTEEVTSGVTLTGTIDNTTITAGTYIIYGNATITGDVTLTDDVELILSDGSKLNITGQVNGYTNSKSLTIYAQSEGSDMGQMNVEKEDANAINLKGLTIHGGKINAKATSTTSLGDGIWSNGDVYIYGGEVKAQGCYRTSGGEGGRGMSFNYGSGTLNILNHARVELIGGNSTGYKGGHGIWGNVMISGDAELKATGGDCSGNNSNSAGGRGIDGDLTASGHAKVTVNGGNGTDNNVIGGMGVASITTVKDYAQLIATGGNGHGSENGGTAISTLKIYDNAYVKASGGNGGSSGNGGNAINYAFSYYGGKFIALAGTKGTSGASDGYAMEAFYNKIAPNAVSIEYTTDGTNWNNHDVSSGYNSDDEVHSRGVRKLD